MITVASRERIQLIQDTAEPFCPRGSGSEESLLPWGDTPGEKTLYSHVHHVKPLPSLKVQKSWK